MVRVATRPATVADTAFARAAHHAAYRAVVEDQFGTWNEQEQDVFFTADWRPLGMEIILAENTACGYWAVEDRAGDLHLRELVVHPDWQGRGVGTELLRRLQRRATERNVPIVLGTFEQNRALALYGRLGFRQVGKTNTHVLMTWQPSTKMPSVLASRSRHLTIIAADTGAAACAAAL